MLLWSCQTEPETFPATTTVIEKVVTKNAICQSGKPILLSRQDVLTDATKEAVGDHNNDFWCKCPDQQPVGFDTAICPKET